jgi:hypothetical protein
MSKHKITSHSFTAVIIEILLAHFVEDAEDVFHASPILGYLNSKTKAANRGSKARGAFANHYALYVVVEDYISNGYADGKAKEPYSKYEGARFSDLFKRQRELPFGAKLQNHALNSRLNDEFKKFYPTLEKTPIVRDLVSQRYWVQEDLLLVSIRRKDGKKHTYNIAHAIIDIIDAYVATKRAAFEEFIDTCRQIAELGKQTPEAAISFVIQQLKPEVDARVFEIVSYAVLKAKYGQESIWIGETRETVEEESLILYKTGRTNANDGGIDFVMKPIGRFFQVTESVDANKYFLDIDKVQRFPITFVIKSDEPADKIRAEIRAQAIEKYKIESIVDTYMSAIEQIINAKDLIAAFNEIIKSGQLQNVMDEVVIQSKVEFNYNDEDEDSEESYDSL